MKTLKTFVFASVLFGLIGGGPTSFALACKAMGPDKHVGMVQMVDLKSHTFSIIDAETGNEITFDTSKEILDQIKIDTRVLVTYQTEGDTLKAKTVES